MKEKFARFMAGRYGADQLSRFVSILCFVLLLIGLILGKVVGTVVYFIALALIIVNIFRMFSKDTAARYRENVKYLKIKNKVVAWFARLKRRIKDSKNYRFFKCPTCKVTARVPKGKGKIRITCPKCGATFERKT